MRHGGVRRRRDAIRKNRESGVSAIEFVFLTPLLFFLIFATVQFAMYFFARHVAIAAAQEGARVARAEAANSAEDWSGDAKVKAIGWINQLAPSLLASNCANAPTTACVSTGKTGVPGADGFTVSVTVTADVPSLIPGVHMSVTETSTGPVEQFIPDN
jgi:Flp pilus assembly protein TadG